ncbi:MAG: TonB-dependent receptor plug domain-containing protein, partial [Gemmatimonadota bacterium]|nr:TonB-dependent receptor plug domain-containing protein [Gemmatimonadota bacterium]
HPAPAGSSLVQTGRAAGAALAVHLPPVAPGVERGLAAGWAVGSAALALLLGFTLVRLARERHGWEERVVAGGPLGVSRSLGPAAVGVFRPRVVIPRWVLELDATAQRLIVAHEREHQRTRDPALLLAGMLAVVAMPWNPGVWLAWRGLRLAVEYDCDERVLARGIDRARYAAVLLGAWERTRGTWLPTAALTGTSGLGSRVQHLMRREPRRRNMKTLMGLGAAALCLLAACETPAPQRVVAPGASKAAASTAPAASKAPLMFVDGVRQAPPATSGKVTTDQLANLPPSAIASVEVLKGKAAIAQYGADGANGVILITTKKAVGQ